MAAFSSIKGDVERTVGVEDTRNTDVDAILTMETVCQCLRDTLTFIVARTRTDGVDVSPARTTLGARHRECKGDTD